MKEGFEAVRGLVPSTQACIREAGEICVEDGLVGAEQPG
jgi:hypothetical protein